MVVADVSTLEIRIGYDGQKRTYWRVPTMFPSYLLLTEAYLVNCPCITHGEGRVRYELENGCATYSDTGKVIDGDRLFELRLASYK